MNQRQLDLPWMSGEAGITEVTYTDEAASSALKRGELHVHMNGAVPASTVREILADEGGISASRL